MRKRPIKKLLLFSIGIMFMSVGCAKSSGVNADVFKYKVSCNKGNGFTCYKLGDIYEYGKDIPVNLEYALYNYKRGCELKDRKSCKKVQQMTKNRSKLAAKKSSYKKRVKKASKRKSSTRKRFHKKKIKKTVKDRKKLTKSKKHKKLNRPKPRAKITVKSSKMTKKSIKKVILKAKISSKKKRNSTPKSKKIKRFENATKKDYLNIYFAP
ncbi:MAG: Unknown protein [uncultured Sulfurovum sp.]|uniref:beta-lactamase n=1 Tax=uncultured Sulfurovum sp. TaxID=269237 RepID=A0A6S6SVI1_9BACT|nr:MAG: Unknown protein [uncultured Sulfurovum sp.]